MVYPDANLSPLGYDYIQIIGHQYVPSGKELTSGASFGTPTGEVQLPIQSGIQERGTVRWGNDGGMNFIEAAMGQAAMESIDAISKGSIDGLKSAATGALDRLGAGAKDPASKYFLQAYFAGQAIGKNITARATGQVVNPNMELLFEGPELRGFDFNFEMTPRSANEASTIKNIIRFFKKNMAPQLSSSKAYLYTPNIFELKYIYNQGGEHPYLNNFKACALSGFAVNYTPTNTYMTYKDGSMVTYKMSLSFQEIFPIYNTDHDQVGGTGY